MPGLLGRGKPHRRCTVRFLWRCDFPPLPLPNWQVTTVRSRWKWLNFCAVSSSEKTIFFGDFGQWTCLGRDWVKTAWKPHINIGSVITYIYIYSVNIWNIYIHILISIHLQLQILSWMWSQPPGSM